MTIQNDSPFEHTSQHGTEFKSDRCDLKNGVQVTIPEGSTPANLIADAVEMGAWHSMNIRPQFNPFNGYDTVKYEVKNA